ncbi:hypothetical protein CORC01_06336 [Colletotrichum orchidophilum]|uniref:FAD/NAD(P)-binding domain-containing protein n=1 Tax=Colletotrichum orchidophilum TaxID=1209926 RepID=A0A1G4BAB4_9PEZI|nr:uncharacterized protein CORC01_06336 [Colletotrichum orchidophilum]OHE98340.1 hypothetical protein CORC01_06336 [Colletotrichum orchidophilum]
MEPSTTATSKKLIIILGGSYGGVSTAHYLLKHAVPALPDAKGYKVILVSPSAQVMCRPACPRALISDDMFPQEKLFVDIPGLFKPYGGDNFFFVQGTATDLDHKDRTVSVTSKGKNETTVLFYHALVIATGASTPSPLLGLHEDSESLRKSWAEFRKALSQSKSIVVVGGGPAGVETAGELGEYMNGRRSKHPKVPITLVSSTSEILPALRPAIARKAERYLAQVGVSVLKGVRMKSVAPAGAGAAEIATNAAVTLDSGKTIEADIYIPATGMRPNTNFVNDTLLLPDGRVDTNPLTLRVDQAGPRVYAIGDASSFARPAIHNILSAIPVMCANIKRDLLLASTVPETAGEDRSFKEDVRETQLVPIGKSKGVGAAMGYQLPSFIVWMIKGRDYWLWTTENLWSGKHWAKKS